MECDIGLVACDNKLSNATIKNIECDIICSHSTWNCSHSTFQMSSMHLICRILLHFVEFDISNAHSSFSSWENNHHDQFIECVSLFYAFDFKEVECDFKKVAFDFPDVAFDFMQMRNWELTH